MYKSMAARGSYTGRRCRSALCDTLQLFVEAGAKSILKPSQSTKASSSAVRIRMFRVELRIAEQITQYSEDTCPAAAVPEALCYISAEISDPGARKSILKL